MSVIAIETAMQHIYAEPEDQNLVQLYLDAAEDQAMQFMQRRFYADTDTLAAAVLDGTAGEDPILLNASIKAACLLILGHLFANREDVAVGVSVAELPMGSRALLMPYRIKMGV